VAQGVTVPVHINSDAPIIPKSIIATSPSSALAPSDVCCRDQRAESTGRAGSMSGLLRTMAAAIPPEQGRQTDLHEHQ
jgi:hypothetical protein